MNYLGCAQIIHVERPNIQLQMWFWGQKYLDVICKEILIKALGGATAIGIDKVVKGFIQMKKENGQSLQEEDSAKESDKEHLEIDEPEEKRQCSLLATLREVQTPTSIIRNNFLCPFPFHGRT